MASDAGLEYLRIAQDTAFKEKQAAWNRQDQTQKRVRRIKDALERAFREKQSAYSDMDAAWQFYQGVRESNGPRIDSLNSKQESSYKSMKDAFSNASFAHDQHDGASAKTYANQGHAYQTDSQRYVSERRNLVNEIKLASERHRATKSRFEQAKVYFDNAKFAYNQAKLDNNHAQADFRKSKAKFDEALEAFKSRLDVLKAESKHHSNNRRAIAKKAGVPQQYLDNIYITHKQDGITNIYFGGVGKPDGLGHGHYAIRQDGSIAYKRDPFDQHGAQNFTDSSQDYYTIIASEIGDNWEFAFNCSFRSYPAYVESSWDNTNNRRKINIYYGPNGPFGSQHNHAVAYPENPFKLVADEIRC